MLTNLGLYLLSQHVDSNTYLSLVGLYLLSEGVLCGSHGVGGFLEDCAGGDWGSQGGSGVQTSCLVNGRDPLLHVHGVTSKKWNR